MSNIEIVNEPTPPPRGSGKGLCNLNVQLIDSKTNQIIKTCPSKVQENERRPRESRKY